MKWICELPDEVQAEIKKDARDILTNIVVGLTDAEIEVELDYIMREKLINVIGDEPGLLSAEKYYKYLNM